MKNNLFKSNIKVLNIGVKSFADGLKESGVDVVNMDFKPPLYGDFTVWGKVEKKIKNIEKANLKALDIIKSAEPFLVGMDIAINVIPGMKKDLILHAGPPIKWENMCGPMKGGIIAALIYEGMAKDAKDAERLASSGKIKYEPCHDHNCVGPMAGIISPSMPVFIVKNKKYGNFSYATMNEGLGKVLRYGAYSQDVIDRLKWMEKVLYPAIKRALSSAVEIDLKSMVAQALHMGDEVHNRNRGGTSLFYRAIAPHIIKTSDKETAYSVLEFINKNDHFFLNLSMAMSKASLDPVCGIKNSTLVYVMARNGTEFGIKVAGMGKKWFTGPAPVPDALFFPGYTKEDANPDIGDSAITETNGLGGFAIAAAPAIVQFVGGKAGESINYTLKMYEITVGENNIYKIPSLDFRGTPTGIDLVKVVKKGIMPFIDTGVAHKKPGVGQVGAGVVKAPKEPFINAFKEFFN
ncbi:MAG: DUF1116 domain-containing protein [Elusimicrobiales bacterium]|nr:DUF1116 domain-containing protein [Elusimicrobiales bacterium]HOL63163.1 DUF1116 domain-containing protein [Elusimicrobiales bacterium]HPO95293.1 DUF1116 domain-containing protein [Elusimicrobiales bacterium]